MQLQASPHLDINKFDGNSFNYQYVMSIFKEVVEGRIVDLSERLTRHIQHTNAEAREFIKTCIKLPTHLGYQNIKVILEKW